MSLSQNPQRFCPVLVPSGRFRGVALGDGLGPVSTFSMTFTTPAEGDLNREDKPSQRLN